MAVNPRSPFYVSIPQVQIPETGLLRYTHTNTWNVFTISAGTLFKVTDDDDEDTIRGVHEIVSHMSINESLWTYGFVAAYCKHISSLLYKAALILLSGKEGCRSITFNVIDLLCLLHGAVFGSEKEVITMFTDTTVQLTSVPAIRNITPEVVAGYIQIAVDNHSFGLEILSGSVAWFISGFQPASNIWEAHNIEYLTYSSVGGKTKTQKVPQCKWFAHFPDTLHQFTTGLQVNSDDRSYPYKFFGTSLDASGVSHQIFHAISVSNPTSWRANTTFVKESKNMAFYTYYSLSILRTIWYIHTKVQTLLKYFKNDLNLLKRHTGAVLIDIFWDIGASPTNVPQASHSHHALLLYILRGRAKELPVCVTSLMRTIIPQPAASFGEWLSHGAKMEYIELTVA